MENDIIIIEAASDEVVESLIDKFKSEVKDFIYQDYPGTKELHIMCWNEDNYNEILHCFTNMFVEQLSYISVLEYLGEHKKIDHINKEQRTMIFAKSAAAVYHDKSLYEKIKIKLEKTFKCEKINIKGFYDFSLKQEVKDVKKIVENYITEFAF